MRIGPKGVEMAKAKSRIRPGLVMLVLSSLAIVSTQFSTPAAGQEVIVETEDLLQISSEHGIGVCELAHEAISVHLSF